MFNKHFSTVIALFKIRFTNKFSIFTINFSAESAILQNPCQRPSAFQCSRKKRSKNEFRKKNLFARPKPELGVRFLVLKKTSFCHVEIRVRCLASVYRFDIFFYFKFILLMFCILFCCLPVQLEHQHRFEFRIFFPK